MTADATKKQVAIVAGASSGLGSRLSELGIELPRPPTPWGAYVESSDVGKVKKKGLEVL